MFLGRPSVPLSVRASVRPSVIHVVVLCFRVWRACSYFIVLSVLFPDGDRSLLAFPSDLLAR